MNTLKSIWLTLVQMIRQIPLLPGAIKDVFTKRHQRSALKLNENERLDRIRNPSKYVGK